MAGGEIMKKEIAKFVNTQVKCTCGNEFVVKSNKKELEIEICNQCHPFYTGVQGRTSKTGRVEKFNKKYGLK